ncbi:hypothetical protein QF032_005519 [Streptomyces achromogenes]|nr:hypothetical protein [Streptomyces achromogenes]
MSATGVTAQASDGVLEVTCPWNPYFVTDARNLRGRWDQGRRLWRFPCMETHAAVLDLLEEIFFADGSGQPGLDVLVDLDRFQPLDATGSMVEMAGRRVISVNQDRFEPQLDATTTIIHGNVGISGDALTWSPGAMLEVRSLPEAYLDFLTESQRDSFIVLMRHGVDVEDLRRQEVKLQERIDQLRLIIQRERQADAGLLSIGKIPEGSLRWRLRCRPADNGAERRTVHLEGCLTSLTHRVLTDAEVSDLLAQGASACRTCGSYKAAVAAGLM